MRMRKVAMFTILLMGSITNAMPRLMAIGRFGRNLNHGNFAHSHLGKHAIGFILRGGSDGEPMIELAGKHVSCDDTSKILSAFDFVILGGGVAAGYCVKELIAQDIGPKKVCVLTEESCHPYERPALTKGYLIGTLPSPQRGGFLCNEIDVYRSRGVEVRTLCKVTEVNFQQRQITYQSVMTAGSQDDQQPVTTIGYNKLVLATGADVERLYVPGNTLANIFYIRSDP